MGITDIEGSVRLDWRVRVAYLELKLMKSRSKHHNILRRDS